MADEFQTGICSGNWWNSTRNEFSGGSSPCSTALNDMGSFGWSTEMEAKARSCEESVSVSGSSIIFQDTHKPQEPDSVSGSAILMDSTLQMMGLNLSSPTIDWNQALLRSSGRAESNFQSMLQDEISLNSGDSSGDCTVTCQGLPTSFPIGSSSYGCSSTLLQGLFEPDPQPRQPRYENQSLNYDSSANYSMNSSELSPSWPKFSHFLKASSPPKQQPTNHLHFSNNTPFWNASATSMNDTRSSSSFLPTLQTQFFTQKFEEKSNSSNLIAVKTKIDEVRDSCSVVKKNNSEPPMKRTRIETPSPLPTFKVRKEKLGDRITALQQLVSPFGKTDTASVLYEAIEYIKFLHDQVSILSTPYMKNGAQIQHQQNFDISKDAEGAKQDLRSRGLCLVPISSTFPVTNETTADFWTPTFGVSYR